MIRKLLQDRGGWYRGNLHMHTTRSDGALDRDAAIRFYAAHGYDFVAVTDHRINGEEELRENITVLSGSEWDTGDNVHAPVFHILCIGNRKAVQMKTGPRPEVEEIISCILEAGGIPILAHPTWSLMDPGDIRRCRGIAAAEIFNSVSDRDGHKYHSSPDSYYKEVRALSDSLCREYGLSIIGEPNRRALTYVEWRMRKLGIRTQRQLVDRDVAECLSLAMDVGQFYALMEDRGYTVQHRSKYPTFVPYGDEHGHRARMKGKAMTEDDLIAYIDKAMTDPTFEVILPKQKRVRFPRGKVTGFRACVLAWTYILGLVNDGVQMQHVVPPKELKRFEQLKKQAAYLTDNHIDTLEQLDARIQDLTQQIDYQTKHRIILNGQKKRPLYDALQTMAMYEGRDETAYSLTPEEQNKLQKAEQLLSNQSIDILKLERERLYADLVEVNRALRSLKTEVRLCEQIKADSTRIQSNLRPFLTEDRELIEEFSHYDRER